MNPDFNTYLDTLIREKGIDGLEPGILAEVRHDLETRLESRMNAALVAALKPEDLSEFEKLLDSASDDEIQAFCQERIPELDKLVADELMGFRQSYLLQ